MASLVALGLLAASSAVASDLPRWLAWPLAVVALANGLRLARHEARKPRRAVVISDNGALVFVDAARVERFAVRWRGPLAFASWCDGHGRTGRLLWWPDTLRPASRRELRLAAAGPAAARPAQSMAT